MRRALLLAVAALGLTASCVPPEEQWREVLGLPEGLELPAIPTTNRPTKEKRELGRRLFYDKRLSGNQTQSCSSCHEQRLAFTDGKETPLGSTGHVLARNSQGLQNAAWNASLTWASNVLLTLEDQLEVPIRNDRPIELGVTDGNVSEVLQRFESDPDYAKRFREAFPESGSGVTVGKIVLALATFCRALNGADSPYDRFVAGDSAAISDAAKRGIDLFNGERFECHHCHKGVNLTVSYRDQNTAEGTAFVTFFNNGLYNVGNAGDYPANDQGLFELTLQPRDRGFFRPQGLRNVAITAPYMHDGSINTLTEVVRHYASGGRNVESGPNAGDGRLNRLKSGLVRGFPVTDDEVADVVAFLESLTDSTFVTNPALSDPFSP
jgi:cytochrome c peroxidase